MHAQTYVGYYGAESFIDSFTPYVEGHRRIVMRIWVLSAYVQRDEVSGAF